MSIDAAKLLFFTFNPLVLKINLFAKTSLNTMPVYTVSNISNLQVPYSSGK